MVFPEAWPVAISRGDFTAAAGWFCFSFDCFSLDCATATSDKHANPNTRILLFILFSPMCGERTTLALSIRAPDKLSPFRLRDVGRLRRARQVTEVLAGRVARAPSPAKIPSMQPRASRSCTVVDVGASVLARALWEEHDLRVCPERSRRAPNRLPLVIPRHLLTTPESRWIMALTSPRLWALL